MNRAGFTFIELLIVMAIVTILASTAIPVYGNFQVASQLNESSAQIIQLIRQAREFSVAGKENSSYGVYFEENDGDDDKVIFYKGDSYATRDSEYDLTIYLAHSIELDAVIVDNEIAFSKGLGVPNNIGTITITARYMNSRVMAVNEMGMVGEN